MPARFLGVTAVPCLAILLPPSTAYSTRTLQMLVPRLPRGHPLDMHLYLSERDSWQAVAETEQPIWTATDFGLAESDVSRHFSYTYRPSAAVQNNGSVFVHAVFVPTGASPNPKGAQPVHVHVADSCRTQIS